jgi:MFS family permease
VLILCMFMMGFSTIAVGLLPTYDQVGLWAPAMLVVLRLIQGFAVAGEISGASSMILEHAPFGRRGFFASFTLQGVQAGQIMAAAVFLPLAHYMDKDAFNSWGWRIPFLLSFIVIVAGYIIRKEVDETPAFAEVEKSTKPKAPVIQAVTESWGDMLRVLLCSLMNVIPVVATIFGAAYAVQPGYGINFEKDIYLWIPVMGNILAVIVIPYVGNLSDKVGRRLPIAVGAIGSGLLSFGYLYAISIHNVPLAIPTRTRVSGMAISQNIGTAITALLPALFVAVAPPGAANIPLTVGAITLAICAIAAVSALSARETYRVHMNDLGNPDAVPVDKLEYDRLREETLATARMAAKAAA